MTAVNNITNILFPGFRKTTLILIFALLIIHPLFSQDSAPPNIVWISCEDISPYLSMYGDSTAHTPVLDRLAGEGTVYTHAFASVAVCAPNRSSIITAMYPISIGTMHMRTGKDVHGWGERSYDGKSKAVDINGEGIPLYSAVIPAYVKCFTEYLREAGYYCTNNQKTDYQFAPPVTAWDENGPEAHWRKREKGQPFFAVFNYGETHESRIWRNKNLPQTADPDKVPLPSYFPDNSVVRQDVARNYSNIELLDRQIGERIKQLEEDGLLDNTIIFFFSDHGGPLPRGKRLHYDSGLRTPLIIRFPDRLKKEYDDQLVSHIDLGPTVLSLANVNIPDYMQGVPFLGDQRPPAPRSFIYGSGDRFDEFTDRVRIVRDSKYLYVRNYHTELPAYKDNGYRRNMDMMNEMLRLHALGELNPDQNYWFRIKKAAEELYDCESDPYNLHNLINDTAYADKLDEMRNALDSWLSETGDRAAIPEKQMFLEMWPGGIQPVTQDPQIERDGKHVILRCPTDGASIAYILSEQEMIPDLDSGWKLYSKPLQVKKGQIIYVMTQRIGFKESEIKVMHF